jgi:uncharacterized protein (DUF952 family)
LAIKSDWEEAERVSYELYVPLIWKKGQFEGTEIDRVSGFIHTSTRIQVNETAKRFYKDEQNLLLVAIDGSKVSFEVICDICRSIFWNGILHEIGIMNFFLIFTVFYLSQR